MTQPFPEPLHFDSQDGSESSHTPDLLNGRQGIVAVLVAPEAHAGDWAPRTALALAEASLAAGCPTGLVDLGVQHPTLHVAANIEATEGLTDVVLFGASLSRVSQWSSAGARVVPAGTLVGDLEEVFDGSAWADLAREASDGGCVLAYAPVAAADAVLSQATDVILLRHAGEEVDALPMTPSLVLEPVPTPAEVPVEAPPLDTVDVEDAAAEPEVAVAESETTVDLDDVVDDGEVGASPMFATPTETSVGAEAPSEFQGLDVEPEWPDFDVPLVVQDPGEVDPLVASAEPEGAAPPDHSIFDEITPGEAEVTIVSDDLGMGPPADPTEEVTADRIEGLVGSELDSLSPAGELGSASADQVTGLDGPEVGSSDWEESVDLDDELEADVPVASEGAEGFDRLDDPWGEPPEPAPATESTAPDEGPSEAGATEVLEASVPNPFDFDPGQGDPLPWEQPEDAPVAAESEEVPVANVTRTRTRTRTKGPRPFLLILFLLLITIVAVLQWLGMLDVAGLDFLRGDAF